MIVIANCHLWFQSPTVINSIVTRLRILGSLFNSLHVETTEQIDQPILLVMQNTMPLYRIIGEKYCTNLEIIEVSISTHETLKKMNIVKLFWLFLFQNLATLFQYGVTTLKDDCKPLLHDILHIIVTVFRKCPQANILTLAKTVSSHNYLISRFHCEF